MGGDSREGKSVLNGMTDGIESAVRAVGLGDETYKFGDLTKKVTQKVRKDLAETSEATVRTVTGDETYRFGDYTKAAVDSVALATAQAEKAATAELFKAFDVNNDGVVNSDDVIAAMTGRGGVILGLTPQQREAMVVALVQFAATAVLAFNLVMNVCDAATLLLAYTLAYRRGLASAAVAASAGAGGASAAAAVVSKAAASPLASAANWATCLQIRATLQLVTAPLLLPLGAASTLVLLLPYRGFVTRLQARLPLRRQRKEHAVLNRVLSLAAAWFIANFLAVSAAAGVLAWLASAVCGVPFLALLPLINRT